jgi:hypothetical protein
MIPEMNIRGKKVSYLTVIRSLIYAMLGTHPDLAFTVGLLSRFSTAPKKTHWEAAKHVLCYLKATTEMKLTYKRSQALHMTFHGYTDADWGGDSETS